MPNDLTPGVYIEEVASGTRSVAGVATSITAFIGRTRCGPANRPLRVQSFSEFDRVFGGLCEQSTLSYAVQHFFANGGTEALIVRVHNGAIAASLAIGSFSLAAANEGDWGAQLRVRIDHDTHDPADATLFNLAVRDIVTGETERFRNLSTDENHAHFVTRAFEPSSNLIRVTGTVPALRPAANAALAGGSDPFGRAFSTAFAANGNDGTDISAAQIIDPALEATQQGLWALEKADLFNLLCIPPFTRDDDVTLAAWDTAATYCARRRAVLIVDPPTRWDEPGDVLAAATGLSSVISRSDSAAIYFPRIMAADPLKEFRTQSFAPCGVVAGVIARTDADRGVWKAPAGVKATMVGVSALSLGGQPGTLNNTQMGTLTAQGVNCLRSIPNAGHVVWGARTLDGANQRASEWKYLAVRRTACFIEESVLRGTQWAISEANDAPLWAQLRLSVETFMQTLFRQGAFQGASPREAYVVKCSHETTSQADMVRGVVNVLVGFAPLKPAEFIVIRLQQKTQRQP